MEAYLKLNHCKTKNKRHMTSTIIYHLYTTRPFCYIGRAFHLSHCGSRCQQKHVSAVDANGTYKKNRQCNQWKRISSFTIGEQKTNGT
jgi:hypothetical protein